ncbi:MAG: SAM-dependent methyltransferase [Dysgonamonadaceae bacterium]|jgi:16S rRNA (cytidine1402-2'-O)-methyltransferase|nr:SAM-dependent methyltransferase [Dysgonamonadaceae bacterium]
MKPASLYLIPSPLGETAVEKVLPAYTIEILSAIRYFIVENERTARRFIKKANPSVNIDDLTFSLMNKHTSPLMVSEYLKPLEDGNDVGIISEAGCPAIADPGSDVIALAQQKNIPVVPLVGPSSILLSLMASGFNGQNFAFNGYLPIEGTQRAKMIKRCEQRVYSENQTQLFIETPYRNGKLIADLLKTCSPATKLCIAADVTCEDEQIITRRIDEWRKVTNLPDLSKRPCLFLIYK